MMEAERPVQLSPDEDGVHFFSGYSSCHEQDDTIVFSDDEVVNRAEGTPRTIDAFGCLGQEQIPPVQLMEGDGANAQGHDLFALQEALQQKAQKERKELALSDVELTVSRQDIVKKLLKLYHDSSILSKHMTMWLKDEMACGDGVQREVFAHFWDSFLHNFCEGSSQFPIPVAPTLQIDDYEALGRIVTHQFLMYGTFPVQISEAEMQQIICGNVNDDCLVWSFLKLLPEKEASSLQSAMNEATAPFPASEVMDIMKSFGSTLLPTRQNIRKIVLDAAKSEMVCKPYLALVTMRDGMGDFWSTTTSKEMEALYALSSPTSAKVIDCLSCLPSDGDEQRIFTWLCRYLNSANEILRRFLRFCTATDVFIPGKLISVRFENMVEIAMRPRARTCFRIITLPKNYQRFTQLRQELDYYFQNKDLWDFQD